MNDRQVAPNTQHCSHQYSAVIVGLHWPKAEATSDTHNELTKLHAIRI